jgi:hypothetical protein
MRLVWCVISHITLVVNSNLLCHTLSFVASLFKIWQLRSALVMQRITPGSRLNGRDLGNDGEEGVTAEINKCAKCDSDDEKLP